MTLTFLGTSSVIPGGGHDTASMIVDGRLLIDTGWYAAIKMKTYGFSPVHLDAVFLTHCHHDHYIGLPHLFFYLCMRRHEQPERPPLKVIGPANDLARVVELARQLLQPERFPDVDYRPELIPLNPGDTYEDDVYLVETCSTSHPVQGLCYRFVEKAKGVVCVVSGDTAYHPPIVAHAKGAHLLVHEASYGKNPAPADNRALHSGAPDAARVALEAGVQRLALIHCADENQSEALEAARRLFPNVFYPTDGETVTL